MKILVVGVNGMLGNSIARAFPGEVKGTYNSIFIESNFNDVKLDITNNEEVLSVVKSVSPDIVFNCAAMTNVDSCEENRHAAEKIHVDGTRHLSEACSRVGAKFVHISTDFVFDGKNGNYSESDRAVPINIYGKTKLAGEGVLGEDDLLIRTCIFGINVENKKSMVEWIVHELENGRPINVFNDSFFTPIYTGHLANIMLEMCRKEMKGLYHVASAERIDKYAFALAVADIFGLDKNLISPSSIKDFHRKAPRPVDTSLRCSKVLSHGIRLNDFKEELKMMKNDWNRN